MASPEDLDRIESRLKSINKFAPIMRCEKASVSIDNVLNIQGFSLERILEAEPGEFHPRGFTCYTDRPASSILKLLCIITSADHWSRRMLFRYLKGVCRTSPFYLVMLYL